LLYGVNQHGARRGAHADERGSRGPFETGHWCVYRLEYFNVERVLDIGVT
jgi:hypothetical protein